MTRRFRTFAAVAALTAALLASSEAAAQSCGAGLAGARRIESSSYALAFRTQPAKIVIGQHFAVEFAVCAKGERPSPEAVQVDALMPEHRHGMNYKTSVRKTGPDRFRADGLMFHMPGRWDLVFEVQGAGQTERLVRSIVVQ